MISHRRFSGFAVPIVIVAACFALISSPAYARHPDRWYRMGDDSAEGAAAGPVGSGNAFGTTFDSVGTPGAGNLQDLTPFGSTAPQNLPQYVNIAAGRPVSAATSDNWAVQFDGVDDYLLGENLNIPSESAANGHGENYTGITDRGYQLWVKPQALPATGAAYVFSDADNHEFRITSTGFWSPETRNDTQITTTAVALNTWTHIAQVRPNGVAGGSLAWVNGRAVVSQTGDYASVLANGGPGLVIGGSGKANPPLGTLTPAAGTYFKGLVDDIDMFVLGGSFGAFNYTKDNGYFTDVFLPSQNAAYSYVDVTGPLGTPDGHNDKVWVNGDMNFDGVRNQADVNAFVAGWRSSNASTLLGGGPTFGDYVTLGKGDLNLDGKTDINDWVLLRSAFAGAASITLPTAAQLGIGVPEPNSVALALTAAIAAIGARKKGKRRRSSRERGEGT